LSTIKIFDDFLNISLANQIENDLTNQYMPFYLTPKVNENNESVKFSTVNKEDMNNLKNKNTLNGFQLVHVAYVDNKVQKAKSFYFPQLIKIVDTIQFKTKTAVRPTRIKCNLKPQCLEATSNSFDHIHRDADDAHYSAVYYPHDTDGDTFFFDNNYRVVERIPPKRNRLVFFNSNILHAAGFPMKNQVRIIVNIVMKGF